MDERKDAAFYDVVGNTYDQSLYFLACEAPYRTEMRRLSAGRRFRRLVDLGCGTGKQTVMIAPLADEVVAVDISASSLEQAKARCAGAGVRNVRFLQESIVAVTTWLVFAAIGGLIVFAYELWARRRYAGTGREPRPLIRLQGFVLWPAMIPDAIEGMAVDVGFLPPSPEGSDLAG